MYQMQQGRRRTAVLPVIALLGAFCLLGPGSGDATTSSRPVVKRTGSSIILHLPAGQQVSEFKVHRDRGVIRRYRVSVASGVGVLSLVHLHSHTAKTIHMPIGTPPAKLYGADCKSHGGKTQCDRYGEPCPMPKGVWHFRVKKLTDPAARVAIRFRVVPSTRS
jgi:hypothetical protein